MLRGWAAASAARRTLRAALGWHARRARAGTARLVFRRWSHYATHDPLAPGAPARATARAARALAAWRAAARAAARAAGVLARAARARRAATATRVLRAWRGGGRLARSWGCAALGKGLQEPPPQLQWALDAALGRSARRVGREAFRAWVEETREATVCRRPPPLPY